VYLPTQEVLRDEPVLTQRGFTRLLAWLDDGVDSRGERYLEIRRRLVAYFDRRNCPGAEELADETLNRIGRTLDQDIVIATRPPARYCYVVARFVLLEEFRRARRYVPIDERRTSDTPRPHGLRIVESSGAAVQEQRLDCLDTCLQQLKPEQRDLIVEYYRDERRQKIERRRALANRLGITMNALGIRACRIRDSLMECVEGCRKGLRRI